MKQDQREFQQFLRGDRAGFDAIYSIYKKILFNYGNNLTRKKDRVEDAVFDAFTQLVEQIGTFKTAEDIHEFLHQKVRDYLREENRLLRPLTAGTEMLEHLADDSGTETIDEYELQRQKEWKEKMRLEALEKLPHHRREDYRSHHYGGMTFEQIAFERGKSPHTIRRNIELARKAIDNHINSNKGRWNRLLLLLPFF